MKHETILWSSIAFEEPILKNKNPKTYGQDKGEGQLFQATKAVVCSSLDNDSFLSSVYLYRLMVVEPLVKQPLVLSKLSFITHFAHRQRRQL